MTRQFFNTATVLIVGISCGFAQSTAPQSTVNVIVRFRSSPDQAGLKRFVAHGAQHRRFFSSIGASLFTVNAQDLNLLAADPDVLSMTVDHSLRATT